MLKCGGIQDCCCSKRSGNLTFRQSRNRCNSFIFNIFIRNINNNVMGSDIFRTFAVVYVYVRKR
jgi:hypothetical protein